MSSREVELARNAYEAFNRGGIDAILEYLDPDIEWSMFEQFSRVPRVFRGHSGVRQVLTVFTDNYDRFRADPHELIDADPFVVAPVRLHGLEKGTSEQRAFELVQVWKTSGGLATHLDVYSSLEEAREAVEASGASFPGGAGSSK